jgi:predicted secreted protein
VKRIFIFPVMASILLLPATACKREVPIYRDPATPITVKLKQEFTIAINSNPATAYMWREFYDETMLEVLEASFQVNPEEMRTSPDNYLAQHYRFKALKKGTTTVTLRLYGPSPERYFREVVFNVTVI